MLNSSRNEKAENDNLIAYAESKNIPVFYGNIPLTKSMSVHHNGKSYIAIDPNLIESSADGKVKIAHELGHCETGSFYTRHSPLDVLEKHEYRADKWAAHRLIPPESLADAIKDGYTEPWQLAEKFDVTEEFIRRTIYIYQCEGVDVEHTDSTCQSVSAEEPINVQATIPAESTPVSKPTEITTVGQLLQLMAVWEKGKRNPSYKSNVGRVSADIMGD